MLLSLLYAQQHASIWYLATCNVNRATCIWLLALVVHLELSSHLHSYIVNYKS
jgi:hypothetical protein